MTSESIPKTMPRSTLACPPAKNFTEQVKSTTQSQARLSSQFRESEEDKNKLHDEEKGFGSRGGKGNFGSTGTNFRVSSKDHKGGLQASQKNLASNLKDNNPSQKKCKFAFILEKGVQLHSEIHVKKWVDYSTKYGLGYLLSDGSTGVYFNDSTKIILDKGG